MQKGLITIQGPISMVYSIHEALRIVLEEGLEARFARHAKNHEILRDGLEDMGFEFLVDPEYRLPMLNAEEFRKDLMM